MSPEFCSPWGIPTQDGGRVGDQGLEGVIREVPDRDTHVQSLLVGLSDRVGVDKISSVTY